MSKRIIAIIIAAILVIGGIVVSAVGIFMDDSWKKTATDSDGISESVQSGSDSSSKIVKLSVNGTIEDTGQEESLFGGGGYNHQSFLKQLDKIKKDKDVKGVLLEVNSPGGGTYESDEIHKKLEEIKAKDKKVYVQMKNMAASGGYYISTPADKIYAGSQTLTGSLGVIISSTNYAELADKLGVKDESVTSGKHKQILNPMKDMTKEERNIMQSIIDDSYKQFVNVIKDGRHMSESDVKKLADGRIYSAQQAKSNGLIDEIGYEDDAIKALRGDIKSKNAQVVTYGASSGFLNFPMAAKSKLSSMIGLDDLSKYESLVKANNSPQPMYLYGE
ncbi:MULTISPECIES: signal peptide peptidase SppA [Mammaliicoccus]|uniref:Signal peptide peptidase SppA n=1 Tax=Mammaliicoccus vitulinus TaxID=71237 RepID=A0A2T4PTI2_9STAP|nr:MULTISPECIES: signal peptide peptidase SppA [Mammaliicoccus]HAL09117.1 signal peptide peptidase SppA [Staphylococcus sp.]MBO3077377.1 signal peptide peptidase SppA [Mammaliicoccus vitulinus]MEB7657044.1 signal peptide peptidase SppA [Mammaliicoccus vitulinus]PNZ39595.1 signal peptide peptidase SppA [Mammaliicoccus vitulinus]PTI29684.1 signal peptide peptidase SppA [Mammaliicoccus vitulinus]